MTKSALLLIDLQNDYFAGGRMALPDMEAAAANAKRLLGQARERSEPLYHVRHIFPADGPFFRAGTEGSEIHNSLTPREGETVIEKDRPNAFVGTGLEDTLRKDGVNSLVICGAMSQMCVDATARAAADVGFAVTVVSDACAASDVSHDGVDVPAKQVHAAIMAPLAATYGHVVTTEDVLQG